MRARRGSTGRFEQAIPRDGRRSVRSGTTRAAALFGVGALQPERWDFETRQILQRKRCGNSGVRTTIEFNSDTFDATKGAG
jgi:hypothetical protein